MGRSTPIAHHHPAFLAQSTTKARTKGDDRRAIEFLLKWCGTTSTTATLQSIDRKSAVRFMDWLPSTRQGLSPVTMNKTLSRLGVYWKWLQNRELVASHFAQTILTPFLRACALDDACSQASWVGLEALLAAGHRGA
jgi:site-specific recombinase XerC